MNMVYILYVCLYTSQSRLTSETKLISQLSVGFLGEGCQESRNYAKGVSSGAQTSQAYITLQHNPAISSNARTQSSCRE